MNEVHERPESDNGADDAGCLLFGTDPEPAPETHLLTPFMLKPMRHLLALLSLIAPLPGAEPWATYDNRPLGSIERPLVLRSYLPDPGIDPSVFSQHDTSSKVAKYNPDQGRDVAGEVKPSPGIVAAISVNFGPALSYVFDTDKDGQADRFAHGWGLSGNYHETNALTRDGMGGYFIAVTIRTDGLAPRRVFRFELPTCTAPDGSPLQNRLAFYTVNAVPER